MHAVNARGHAPSTPRRLHSNGHKNQKIAALAGLGVPTGPVIASIHEMRGEFRYELQAAVNKIARPGSRGLRAKSSPERSKSERGLYSQGQRFNCVVLNVHSGVCNWAPMSAVYQGEPSLAFGFFRT